MKLLSLLVAVVVVVAMVWYLVTAGGFAANPIEPDETAQAAPVVVEAPVDGWDPAPLVALPVVALPDDTPTVNQVPEAKRQRLVQIDPTPIQAVAMAIEQGRMPQRISLECFVGDRVEMVFADAQRHLGRYHSVVGVLEGVPGSQVVATVNEGILAVSIKDPVAQRQVAVEYAGNGVHRVYEVEPDMIKACGVPGGDFHSPKIGAAAPVVEAPNEHSGAPLADGYTTAGTYTVDFMAVWTPAAEVQAGGSTAAIETRIGQSITQANTAFTNTGMNIQFNLVHAVEYAYTEASPENSSTDLNALTNNTGVFAGLDAVRDSYHADVVQLYCDYSGTGGLGWIGTPPDSGNTYSVVRVQQVGTTQTTAHEVGHNVGCAHDSLTGGNPGHYSYSHGYRFTASGDSNDYSTVMAYANLGYAGIDYWSDPDSIYQGSATGHVTDADNERTWENNVDDMVAVNDDPTALGSFSFAAISDQAQNGSFSVTISAKNNDSSADSDFTGAVQLEAVKPEVQVAASSAYSNGVMDGTGGFRVQSIYTAAELAVPATYSMLRLNVKTVPGGTLEGFCIRMQHTALSDFDTTTWVNSGWTTVYDADLTVGSTGWVEITFSTPFAYNGTDNLLIDFSAVNGSASTDGEHYLNTAASDNKRIGVWFGSGYDAKNWNSTAYTATSRPAIQLQDESSYTISPTASGSFTAGSWTGSVAISDVVSDVLIRASNGEAIGYSDTFDVVSNASPVITEGASTGVTMDEDGSPSAFSLTLNASDGDGHTLTWSISSAASNGSAGVSGTGTSKAITYAPTANWNGSDSFDVTVTDTLGATDTITVNVTVDPRNDGPVNTLAPAISGTVSLGTQLSASTGAWNDDTDQSPGSIGYARQWYRSSDGTVGNAVAIGGETGSTYTVTASDAGQQIGVKVTATDDGEGLPSTAATEAWSSFVAAEPRTISVGASDGNGAIDGNVILDGGPTDSMGTGDQGEFEPLDEALDHSLEFQEGASG